MDSLNRRYGEAVVTQALQRVADEMVEIRSPYPFVRAVCDAVARRQ